MLHEHYCAQRKCIENIVKMLQCRREIITSRETFCRKRDETRDERHSTFFMDCFSDISSTCILSFLHDNMRNIFLLFFEKFFHSSTFIDVLLFAIWKRSFDSTQRERKLTFPWHFSSLLLATSKKEKFALGKRGATWKFPTELRKNFSIWNYLKFSFQENE